MKVKVMSKNDIVEVTLKDVYNIVLDIDKRLIKIETFKNYLLPLISLFIGILGMIIAIIK